MSGSRVVADLALDLGDGPVGHELLAGALRGAVRERRLRPGTRLPSSRDLAAAVGCSRWVVTEAYGLLVADGTLTARTGSGTWVPAAPAAPAGGRPVPPARPVPSPRPSPEPAGGADLTPGVPERAAFPRARWRGALAGALARATHEDLAVRGSLGLPELRDELRQHLAQTRGAHVGDDVVVAVTRGSGDALDRLLRVLRRLGQTHVALAEPCPDRLRVLAAAEGLTVVGIGSGPGGLRVEDLERSPARAVVVAPAALHPWTHRLDAGGRERLVRWARAVDGVIVEDDSDGPLAPPRAAPVLQAAGPDRVILVGSADAALGAGVGLGWILLPEPWMHSVAPRLPAMAGPPVLEQLALADLIASGDLVKHVRRMRARYRRRGRLLGDALAAQLPGWSVDVPDGALHVRLDLPPGAGADAAARVAAEARRAGLVLPPADPAPPADAAGPTDPAPPADPTDPGSSAGPTDPATPSGFALGFANLPESRVGAVAAAVGSAARRAGVPSAAPGVPGGAGRLAARPR